MSNARFPIAAAVLLAWLHAADATEDHAHHGSGDPQTERHEGHASEPGPIVDPHAHHRAPADEPTQGERTHVPPEAPQHSMDVPSEKMAELMQMEDDAPLGMVVLDQFEWRTLEGPDVQAWSLEAWYGGDYDKARLVTEGERVDGRGEGRVELLWDRIISPWWSLQAGVRQDFGAGPSRTWFDLGAGGVTPYFVDVEAALYVGEQGRTMARLSGEYEVNLTQALILRPDLEVQLYGKDDPDNGIGAGLATIEAGVRLRYEIRREFAPYLGCTWVRMFGRTADLAREEGDSVSDLSVVIGLRAWF